MRGDMRAVCQVSRKLSKDVARVKQVANLLMSSQEARSAVCTGATGAMQTSTKCQLACK